MTVQAPLPTPFLDRHAEAVAGLGGPGWLGPVRQAGIERYRAAGLPTTRAEAWKYTSVVALAKIPFVPAALAAVPAVAAIPDGLALAIDAPRLVLINGRLAPHLSDPLPAGFSVGGLEGPFAHPESDEPGFASLNAAYAGEGLAIRIGKGAAPERPLHLIAIAAAGPEPTMHHPRLAIVAEAGSRATVIESHCDLGGAATLANVVAAVTVADGAVLDHCLLHGGTPAFHWLGETRVSVAAGGMYERVALTLGGALVRSGVEVRLEGRGAEGRLYGTYAADGTRHVDNTLIVRHLVPDTVSRQLFKGVLDDNARGVFQGRIEVHRDAQRSDGQQLHKALLLSRGAEVDAKPELEIYADDVKCSHGATAGELDEDALFFLRARGIDEATARALLVEAFLDDVIDRMQAAPVRDAARAAVAAWLHRKG